MNAGGAGYVEDARQATGQVAVDTRSIDRFQQGEIFPRAAQQAVKQRIPPPGDALDFHDVVGRFRHVIPEHLAERAFRTPFVRQDAPLDDDLGLKRYRETGVTAGIHLDRRARQLGGQRILVDAGGQMGARGKKHRRRHADQQSNGQRLAGLLGTALVVGKVVAVTQPQAQFIGAHVHRAVKRQVGHAGIRVQGQHNRGREVGSGVPFVVGDQRQVRQPALLQVAGRPHLGCGRLHSRLRGVKDLCVSGRERLIRASHHAAKPRCIGKQIGCDAQPGCAHILEQQGQVARLLGTLGDCSQLKARIDLPLHGQQFA